MPFNQILIANQLVQEGFAADIPTAIRFMRRYTELMKEKMSLMDLIHLYQNTNQSTTVVVPPKPTTPK